jgi:hypothetical protein
MHHPRAWLHDEVASSRMKECLRKLPGGFGCTNLVGSLNECALRLLNSLKLVTQGVQNDTNKVCLRVRPTSPIDYLQKLVGVVSRLYFL